MRGKKKGGRGRDKQARRGGVHPRSEVYHMVSERSFGKKKKKKTNGKWRMCIDYIDLDKACLKDSYPLPSINLLVDGAFGYEILSLIDAYSGYNHIWMFAPDVEKTGFMSNRANYCYQVMLFGLKNAMTTYQRLMDRDFQKQIGKNMEVYFDDIVVKSAKPQQHASDLQEIFEQLGRYNIRLNLEKCNFRIKSSFVTD